MNQVGTSCKGRDDHDRAAALVQSSQAGLSLLVTHDAGHTSRRSLAVTAVYRVVMMVHESSTCMYSMSATSREHLHVSHDSWTTRTPGTMHDPRWPPAGYPVPLGPSPKEPPHPRPYTGREGRPQLDPYTRHNKYGGPRWQLLHTGPPGALVHKYPSIDAMDLRPPATRTAMDSSGHECSAVPW